MNPDSALASFDTMQAIFSAAAFPVYPLSFNRFSICPTWMSLYAVDPAPKSCSIQKQNPGMMFTPPDRGCADKKVTIH